MIRPIPPVLFLACLALLVLLHRELPVFRATSDAMRAIGWAVAAAGAATSSIGVLWFKRMRTTVHPGEGHATTLVTSGPYRITRNPMYLGMSAILLGAAAVTGAATTIAAPTLFVLLIDRLWIVREERWMTEAFGDEYESYRRRVRRWI